jgi:hypothetical protein
MAAVCSSAFRRSSSALLALASVAAWAGDATTSRHDGTYLHEVRTDIETPHTKWLKPSALPKPSLLFLARRPGNLPRRIVEVWQRMDLDFTAYTLAPDANERDYWESNIAGSRTEEKQAEAIQKLSKTYDAIVLLGFDINWLPNEAKYWLLRQVKGGCGLVAVDSGVPFKLTTEEAPLKAIATGIPFSGLPGFSSDENLKRLGAKLWRDIPSRVIHTGQFGQGRVASISFAGFGIEPEDEVHSDYHYALIIKALQWAVPKCLPPVRFVSLPEGASVERAALEKGEFKPSITVSADAETKLAMLTAIRHPLLGELATNTQTLDLKAGENTVALSIPPLPAGQLFFDIRLRNDKGFVSFASFAFTVASPDRIAELTLQPFIPESERAVRWQAKLAEPLKAAAALRVSVTDTYGRLVADASTPLRPGAQEAKGEIPLGLVVATANWARVELRAGKDILDARQALLIVRRRDPHEYPALLWGGCEAGLDGLRHLRRQRETGFNISLVGVQPDGSTARFAALADMQLCIYATHISGVSDGKTGKVANPEVLNKAVAATVEKCRASAPYGVLVYSLGDECYTGGYRQPFAPADVAAYREFLKAHYGSLEELNRVWQTQFKAFDEIAPVDWEKSASDPKLFPQLHERAAFVEHLYAKTMHDHAQALTAMDPQARVGAEGSEPGDLELTLQGLKMWGPYSDRRIDVLLHSLAPRELVRGMWWGGYHSGFFDRATSVRYLWRQVLEGVSNTNFFFDGHVGHHESNVSSDLTWAAYFEKMISDLRAIYETPGPLLSAAEPLDFGVALLWSQASEHASLFHAPFGTTSVEMNAAFAQLDALGVNYRFVTARQIERDGLDPSKVKLFLLPTSAAISEKLAKALEVYVAKGGILLATGSTGLMDGHCRLLEKGQLDKLFGIKRTGPPKVQPVKLSSKGQLFGVALEAPVLEINADSSLRADGATVALAAGDVPILTVNPQRRGKAIFLSAALSFIASKGKEGEALARAIFNAIAAEAKLESLLAVEPKGAARAYTFSLGKATLVSFIGSETAQGPATVRLARKAHVYDCLKGQYLGEQQEIRREPVAGNGRPDAGLFGLYSLLDRKAAEPKLRVADEAKRGDLLKVRVSLDGGDGRLLRLDPYRPDGTWARPLRRFIRLSGSSDSAAIPFAHNDPAGPWTLRLTDLATGLSTSAKVTLK